MGDKERDKPRRLDPYKLVGSRMGRYRIVELIGDGGMGAVYHAQHDLNPEARFALKILKPDLAYRYPEAVEDFLKEARLTMALNHPGIIRVLHMDYDDEHQLPYFIMEWLDGQTLDDVLKERGRMSLAEVTELLDQVTQAVSHAHGRGLVHRDLKPGNIMLVNDGRGGERAKVLDFGIAKAVDSTKGGVISRVMGAPYYASPEQLNVGDSIDLRSDIYSLGVTVYQMLTGELPFSSTSIKVVITQHLSEPPPRLRSVLPEIPVSVEDAVLRALMKRPEARYSDAVEFARAFRRAAGLEPGSLALSVTDAQERRAVARASIYIGGVYSGSTDGEGQFRTLGLNPGDYPVRVEAQQYKRHEETVAVGPNSEVSLTWELELHGVGDLSVKTNVSGAELLLNGEGRGRTDAAGGLHLRDLTPGTFSAELRLKGHMPFSGEVEVRPGQTTVLEVKLEKLQRSKLPLYIAAGVALLLVGVALAAFIPWDIGGGSEAEALAISLSSKERARQAEELRRKGAAQMRAEDYASAEAIFREAANLENGNAENLYLLGEALFKQKEKWKEAAHAFYDAALLRPDEALYAYKLGEAFSKAEEYKCAEHEYEMASSLGPDRAEYHEKRGDLYLNWWKYPQAVAEYKRALELLPPEADASREEAELRRRVTGNQDSAAQSGREYPRQLTLREPPCKSE